jgi:hypothetical protein
LDLLLRLKPGYAHLLSKKPLYLDSLSGFGICYSAIAAQMPSAKLLYLDSKLVALQLVPRFRQLAIKFVPGWQKPRHASLLAASNKSCLKD